MADQRRAGLIQVKVNGVIQDAKGTFTYNLGSPKREAIIGSDGVHGYKETPQVPFCEGMITDRQTLDVEAMTKIKDATVIIALSNGKTFVLADAWYAGDGNITTTEAEVVFRFEGSSAKET